MLQQLLVLMWFHNKILLYVFVIMYCRVTLCNLWHECYLNDMLLFYCITAWCNLLLLISFLPLFCNSKFNVNRNNFMQNIRINFQNTSTGRKLLLNTTISACLHSLGRWILQVCPTLRNATVSGNVELK